MTAVKLFTLCLMLLGLAFGERAYGTEVVAQKSQTFKASMLVETLTSLYTDGESARSYSGFYALSMSYQKPTNYIYALKVPFIQEYTYKRDDGPDGDFANLGYSASRVVPLSGFLDQVSIMLAGAIPAGHETQHSTFQGSIGPGISAKTTKGRFSFSTSGYYRYAFYDYDLNDNGTVNSPHNFILGTDASVAIFDKVTVSAALTWFHSINFRGTGRSSVWPVASLDYNATKNIALGFGVSTLRGTLAPDGQSNELTLIDPETSQIFFDITVAI